MTFGQIQVLDVSEVMNFSAYSRTSFVTPAFLKQYPSSFFGTVSYAFSKLMNTKRNSFCFSLYFAISILKANNASFLVFPGIKLYWCSQIFTSFRLSIFFLQLLPIFSLCGSFALFLCNYCDFAHDFC